MDKKWLWVQRIAAAGVLVTLLVTVVSFFITGPTKPPVASKPGGNEDVDDKPGNVTNTESTPWISVDSKGLLTLYPENMLGMTELVIPDAVNGVPVTGFALGSMSVHPRKIKSIIFPAGFSVNGDRRFRMSEWESLEIMIFSEGVIDLGKLDVFDMPNLREIYIPKSLTTGFYLYSLRNCGEHVTIYYAGTEEEWAALGEWSERFTKMSLESKDEDVPQDDVTQDGTAQGGTPQSGTTQGGTTPGDTTQGDTSQENPPQVVWPKITIVFNTSFSQTPEK